MLRAVRKKSVLAQGGNAGCGMGENPPFCVAARVDSISGNLVGRSEIIRADFFDLSPVLYPTFPWGAVSYDGEPMGLGGGDGGDKKGRSLLGFRLP